MLWPLRDRAVVVRLVMARLVMARLVMVRLVMARLVMARLVMVRLVMVRLVMVRLVMACPVLVCLVMACLAGACAGEPEFVTGAGPGADTPSTCAMPVPVPDEVRERLGLSRPFYARHCSALGIDVLASESVPDAVMDEAGRIVEGVLGERPDLRDALHDRYFRVVLVASSAGEQLSDVPELHGISAVENAAAGLGPDPAFPAATMRDSVIACRATNQDPLATPPGDTLVHELGHAVLDMGLANLDPGFAGRLRAAHAQARDAGTWTLELGPGVAELGVSAQNYLMTNAAEYWATGVSAWFGFKSIPLAYEQRDSDPGVLRLRVLYGRDALRDRDPELAGLLEEVFGPEPALTTRCRAWVPKFGVAEP